MSNIVSIISGEALTTTLAVAEGVGNPHSTVIRLVRENKADLEEFGLLDFKSESTGGRPTEFALLNEDQATLLITYMRNNDLVRAFKKILVKAFRDMRKGNVFQLPQTLPEALRLAAELAEENAEMKPKARALDLIATSDGSLCITNAAKDLQMRPKDLFAWLSANKWIYRRTGGSGWIAYQDKIQSGHLEHKVTVVSRTDGSEKTTEQVRVTPKGLTKLAKVLGEQAAA